ncbi:MAG TPA: DnaJ domain-containing protein [Pyrinomonadaceae bacterium]|nr:DnaJ domain-containing protein [Pyrinomonadaceae bacterium]
MNSQTNLEIKGNLREHRLAELLIEIFQANLNGSLRVSAPSQKIVVYFDAGDVVFAVSNARAFRLFELLLRENKIEKQQLAAIADFTNDLTLKEHLLKNNLLSKPEIDSFFSRQIKEILKDAFGWREGEWIFSPLVRIKGDIRFKVDAASLLLEHARGLPDDELARNFKNLNEVFGVKTPMPVNVNLLPTEAFVLSRFENSSLDAAKVLLLSGLPNHDTLRILYVLWLGGFLARRNWNSPFSDRSVSAILSANLTLKKDETPPAPKIAETLPGFSKNGSPKIQPPTVGQNVSPAETAAPVEAAISLEDYLEQTQNAPNYYRLFDVAPDASVPEIKQAYFSLAKRFHPDLFHTEIDAEKHRRIQNAFTKIAQAYETLKNESARTVYDYKMCKELAEMEKFQTAGASENPDSQKQTAQAKADYEHGFALLMDGDYETALPFLARAAHLVQTEARYRACYGRALAADGAQKHKAEAELQAALRLEPDNADIRLMLAEFFVQVNLLKRAEGELNRLLAIFPSNREARALLDSLPKR